MKLQVGIFFGGSSRGREQSFASAKNIFQQLDQCFFEPIPIFVDIYHRLYALPSQSFDQENIKALLAQAYAQINPTFQAQQESYQELAHQDVSEVLGSELAFSDLPQMINIALLCSENNQEGVEPLLKALLENRIPFVGASLDKITNYHTRSAFKNQVDAIGINTAPYVKLTYAEWEEKDFESVLSSLQSQLQNGIVLSPDFSISSFARSISSLEADPPVLRNHINRSFFCEEISSAIWQKKSSFEKSDHVQFLGDLQEGLGYPIRVESLDKTLECNTPQSLLSFLENQDEELAENQKFFLKSELNRSDVIVEEQVTGTSFSCMIVDDQAGKGIALYPFVEGNGQNAGPILTQLQLQLIQVQCMRAYEQLDLSPCATFNGVFTIDDQVFLNECWINPDLNSLSPTVHQLSLLNWSIADFLSYWVQASLQKRIQEFPDQKTFSAILAHLQDLRNESRVEQQTEQVKLSLLVEGDQELDPQAWRAAQFAKEQLEDKYALDLSLYTILTKTAPFRLKRLPLKELEQVVHKANQLKPPLLLEVEERLSEALRSQGFEENRIGDHLLDLKDLDAQFALLCGSDVFQDGRIHSALSAAQIPVNGAQAPILARIYDRAQALRTLQENGLKTVQQIVVNRDQFMSDLPVFLDTVESQVVYPMTAHTGDHDYVNLKQRINDQAELLAYAKMLFRPQGTMAQASRDLLKIESEKEIPVKKRFVLEPLGYLLSPQYIPFRTSLLSKKREALSPGYDWLGFEVNINGNWAFLNGEKPEEEISTEVLEAITTDLEKAALALNLQSYACIEGYLRIFGDDNVELIFTNIDALPFLVSESILFRHGLAVGYSPIEIFEYIVSFGLNRNLPLSKNTSEPIMVNEEDFNEDPSLEPEEPQEEPSVEVKKTDEPLEEKEQNFFQRIWGEIKALMQATIFWRNLAAIIVTGLILFFSVVFVLNRYTYHGKSYIVEDYVGMDFDEAKRKAKGKTFRATIIDSIFIIGEEPNIVKEQDPQPGSKVKKKRTIYMWVTGGQAPEILLPSLAGKDDFETYRRELERRGIKLVIKERRFDRKLEPNTLMGFYYKGKSVSPQDIESGFKVIKGTTLEAIISERTSDEVAIPNLVCQTFEDAKFQIEGNKLTLGEVYGTRNNSSYVWKQEPPFIDRQKIKTGTVIKLHLSTEKPDGCD